MLLSIKSDFLVSIDKQVFLYFFLKFLNIKEKKWTAAFRLAKKVRDKDFRSLVWWMYLKEKSNKATFTDYKQFIERVKKYPRLDRIKYLAEHKISNKNQSPNEIINWFNIHKPISGFGEMILGESYLLIGKKDKGIDLIKKGIIDSDGNSLI